MPDVRLSRSLRTQEGYDALLALQKKLRDKTVEKESPEILEEKRRCEQSLSYFLQCAWRYIDPNPFSGNWHLDLVAEHLEAVTNGEIKRLIINVPPRTAKSSMVSIAWPVWTWIQEDYTPLAGSKVQFLFSSYAQTLSERDSVKCRRLIESPWFQKRWGDKFKLVGDQNTKRKFENSKGGYRLATSVGGALTGEGGAILVVDDPTNANEVASEAARHEVTQWWSESFSTRLNSPRDGAYVVIMQRLAENDLTGHIIEHDDNGEWVHLNLPMEFVPELACEGDPRTEPGELLWPERFNEETVASLKQALGPYAYASQMQQVPVPRGGGIIKQEWWQVWPPAEYENQPQLNLNKYPMFEFILASCDTAYTAKQENDYSACVILGVWADRNNQPKVMVVEAWKERLEFHDLVQKIITTCRNRRVDALLLEAKASGLSIKQEINRLCREEEFAVHAINPGSQDKVARLHSVVPLFAAGCIYAPDRQWADDLISEVGNFPKGKHDDQVDALSQGLWWLHRKGMALLPREAEIEITDALMFKGGDDEELYPQ